MFVCWFTQSPCNEMEHNAQSNGSSRNIVIGVEVHQVHTNDYYRCILYSILTLLSPLTLVITCNVQYYETSFITCNYQYNRTPIITW